jgi:hypothetical protein
LSSTIFTLDAPRVSQSSSTDVGALHCTAAVGPENRMIADDVVAPVVLVVDDFVVVLVVGAADEDVVAPTLVDGEAIVVVGEVAPL